MTESAHRAPPCRIAFKTIGCRLNQAETAVFADQFRQAGFQTVNFGQPADVSVIHSCAVTENARRTSVRMARLARRASPDGFVALTGCAAEAYGDALKDVSGVDLVLAQCAKADLYARVLEGLQSRKVLNHFAPSSPSPSDEPRPTRALLKVQDGCDFNCAYCIVPRLRGHPLSVSCTEVLAQARRMADRGVREVVLTGANVGTYRDGSMDLVSLIEKVEELPNIARIRVSSIELSPVAERLLNHMAASRKLCHHIHIPLQSGSDRILVAMGRRYAVADFRRFVERAWTTIPMLGLGTDVIVGLPGETETDFKHTVQLIEELPLSNIHVFPYSRRPDTRAATMADQVLPAELRSRTIRMNRLSRAKAEWFAAQFVGRSVSVLLEHSDADTPARGWTSEYVACRIARDSSASLLRTNQIIQFQPSTCTRAVLS